jgi:hypothetical protein
VLRSLARLPYATLCRHPQPPNWCRVCNTVAFSPTRLTPERFNARSPYASRRERAPRFKVIEEAAVKFWFAVTKSYPNIAWRRCPGMVLLRRYHPACSVLSTKFEMAAIAKQNEFAMVKEFYSPSLIFINGTKGREVLRNGENYWKVYDSSNYLQCFSHLSFGR